MPRRLPGAPAALVDIFRATCQAGQGDRSPPAPAGALSGTQLPLSPPPAWVPPAAASPPVLRAPERRGPSALGCHTGSHCWGRAPPLG